MSGIDKEWEDAFLELTLSLQTINDCSEKICIQKVILKRSEDLLKRMEVEKERYTKDYLLKREKFKELGMGIASKFNEVS